MDLESWTPRDKARRITVLIAGYFACFMFVVFWMVLNWPWYLSPLGAVASYAALYYPLFALLRRRIRR
ncbi:hypothetical protein [Deinococcus pimensis]|uniref:hypothetical protein n=1 Tax=Deinococcus pimensis TaxID=309888 RepID=UPI0004832BCD|nr:hypothetical protein [Deinococcus pimensis]